MRGKEITVQTITESPNRVKHRYAVQRGTQRVIIEAPSRAVAEIVFIKLYHSMPEGSVELPRETHGPVHVREHEVQWDA